MTSWSRKGAPEASKDSSLPCRHSRANSELGEKPSFLLLLSLVRSLQKHSILFVFLRLEFLLWLLWRLSCPTPFLIVKSATHITFPISGVYARDTNRKRQWYRSRLRIGEYNWSQSWDFFQSQFLDLNSSLSIDDKSCSLALTLSASSLDLFRRQWWYWRILLKMLMIRNRSECHLNYLCLGW